MDKRVNLATRRRTRGYTQEMLAAQLRVAVSTIKRWESGATTPAAWVRPRLARALDMTDTQLHQLLEPAPALPQGTVSLIDVAAARQALHDVTHRYHTQPAAALVGSAGETLGLLAAMRARPAPSAVHRDIHVAFAEAAIVMSKLVWDASARRDNACADAYLRQAIDAVETIGHPALASQAMLRRTYIALYGFNDPVEGLSRAQHAIDTATGNTAAVAALGHLHAAEAHARLGSTHDCYRHLSLAENAAETIHHTDAFADLFSPTQLGRLTGSCYLSLGKPRQALTTLQSTAHQFGSASKSMSIVLANQAHALLQLHHHDEAIHLLHQAIDIIENTRAAGGLNLVATAAQHLTQDGTVPHGHDIRDRLLSLLT